MGAGSPLPLWAIDLLCIKHHNGCARMSFPSFELAMEDKNEAKINHSVAHAFVPFP